MKINSFYTGQNSKSVKTSNAFNNYISSKSRILFWAVDFEMLPWSVHWTICSIITCLQRSFKVHFFSVKRQNYVGVVKILILMNDLVLHFVKWYNFIIRKNYHFNEQ